MEAKRICVEEQRPVLIEALTYRVSHHSTSDDSYAYRSKEEVSAWQSASSPISRFKTYLETMSLWDSDQDTAFRKSTRIEILKAFSEAEKVKKPRISDLFTDVFSDMPLHLRKQQKELDRVRVKYPEFYNDDAFAK